MLFIYLFIILETYTSGTHPANIMLWQLEQVKGAGSKRKEASSAHLI